MFLGAKVVGFVDVYNRLDMAFRIPNKGYNSKKGSAEATFSYYLTASCMTNPANIMPKMAVI